MEEIDSPKISINIDELEQLVEEVYKLDLIYQILVYDATVYKQMANVSFNVMLPLRKTNKIENEHMLEVASVINISWKEYQRLIVPGGNRYCSMVNLFNVLQYKFKRPLIKLKNPLDEKKDMPSSRQLHLMYEADKNSIDYKECKSLIDYYEKNKR
jgi:hypothetical protein